MKDVSEIISSLKTDRDTLMRKYIDHMPNLSFTMANHDDSLDNVMNHKHLIKVLLGMLNNEEDLRVNAETARDDLRLKVDALLYKVDAMVPLAYLA